MHPRRALLPAAALLAALVLTAACGDDDVATNAGSGGGTATTAAAGGSPEVVAKLSGFEPADVEISVGETVTWLFDDGTIPHNVKADGGAFKSPTLTGDEWSHTFEEPGTYEYLCTLHPSMEGTVTVTA